MNKTITLRTDKENHRKYTLSVGAHLTRMWENYEGPSLDILLGLKYRYAQLGAGKVYSLMFGFIFFKVYIRINSIGLPKPGAFRRRRK